METIESGVKQLPLFNGSGSKSRARAFLRWIGGKRLLIGRLLPYIPTDAAQGTYYEPFFGAGSLYFNLRPESAVLSDLNEHLIECYKYVRKRPVQVAAYLKLHAAKNSEAHYYKVRETYNRRPFSAAQAARFIYLNQTCFNGVFRVNRQGAFNVPFGDKPRPQFPTIELLHAVSDSLRPARLVARDYEQAVGTAREGNFVYLDPPYPPLNGTSNFTHYTADRFGVVDQERLASVFLDLDARGCVVMMTNADTSAVRSLYRGFNFFELSVTRYVTCKKTKHRVGELVITNYGGPTLRTKPLRQGDT